MHWDKRDDDLLSFEGLPKEVWLVNGAQSRFPGQLTSRVWAEEPPVVPDRPLRVDGEPGAPVALHLHDPRTDAISSSTPDEPPSSVREPDRLAFENVCRVRVAALREGPTGQVEVVPLLDESTGGRFTRVGDGPSGFARSGWESIGGPPGGERRAGCGFNAAGLVAFARSGDSALWHAWQDRPDGHWSGWESLGAELTSDPGRCCRPAAAWWSSCRRRQRHPPPLADDPQRPGRAGEPAIGGPPGGRAAGRVRRLQRRRRPGGLRPRRHSTPSWHAWQDRPDGHWSGWESLGGGLTSDPGAVLQTGGRLVVFVRTAATNAIHHRWQTTRNGAGRAGSRSGAAGGASSGPGAAASAAGGLVAFARGGDNALWRLAGPARTATGRGWESLGGGLTTTPGRCCRPAAAWWSSCARGGDSTIHHRWRTTRSFGEYRLMMSGGPGGRTDGLLHVFRRGGSRDERLV